MTAVHAFEHAFEHALLQAVQHASAHLGIEILSKTGGGAIHGLIKGTLAARETRKARKMENLSKENEGLVGFSRTMANRKITRAWTEAAAGTSGSIGIGLIGAGVGQVYIFPDRTAVQSFYNVIRIFYKYVNAISSTISTGIDSSTRRWCCSWRSSWWCYRKHSSWKCSKETIRENI